MKLTGSSSRCCTCKITHFRLGLGLYWVVVLSECMNLQGPAAAFGYSWSKLQTVLDYRVCSLNAVKSKEHRRKLSTLPSALPETAASVAIAATVVGAAATFLVRRTQVSDATEVPSRPCEDCGGSGICSECKGEGFVLKKMSDESAERARMTAKNMATRYTAGLPKKWSYCTKCSSSRSCSTCGGTGELSY